MEVVASLFDCCDTACLGKVPVSKLILAVKNEANTDNDPKEQEKEEMLTSIRLLLDPLNEDLQIDKSTWMASWRSLAGQSSPQKSNGNSFRNLAGGDISHIMDTSSEGQGSLNQSKHSFCFSPGSRSSSIESEPEELVLLREENQQLQSTLKHLKQELENSEDALLQEHKEKQVLEKSLKDEINRLARQSKFFQESNKDFKFSLDTSERERLDLCKTVENLTASEKQLKKELFDHNKMIVALHTEIGEFNQEKERFNLRVLQLQTELDRQAKAHQAQVNEFLEVIQNVNADKEELSSKIVQSLLDKRDLAARLEEIEYTTLESELQQIEGCPSDSSSFNVDDLDDSSVMAADHITSVSTPLTLGTKNTVSGSSLLDELQAVGSFINSSNDLDSSNDGYESSGTRDLPANDGSVKEVSDLKPSPVVPLNSTLFCNNVRETQSDVILNEDNVNIEEVTPVFSTSRFFTETDTFYGSVTSNPLVTTSTSLEDSNQEPLLRINQYVQTMMIQMADMETQTQGRLNNVCVEPPRKFDQSMQTMIEVYHIETQTQSERNVEEPLRRLDKSIQTEIRTCAAERQNISSKSYDRGNLNSDLEEPSSTGISDLPNKPMSLTLRMSDNQYNVQNKTSPDLIDSSLRPRLCFAALFTFIFLALLFLLTILCTGGVLEIANERGFLSYPYYGSTPGWIKSILRPLVKVHRSKVPPA